MRKKNNMTKKIFVFGFVFMLILSGVQVGIGGMFSLEKDGQDIMYNNGDGTLSDPYVITNLTELQNVSADLGAHYRLGNDIDASGTYGWAEGFAPIGNGSSPFNGTFEGRGFVISGLYIDRPSTDNVGLFGMLKSSAVVKNITLIDVNITGGTRCGALVGRNFGNISNCSSYGSVNGFKSVGGLVGNNKAHIDNSTSYCTVTSIDWNAGGLIGYMSDGSVLNSYATGAVSGDERIGGFVGRYFGARSHIENCYSSGFVTGNDFVGGFSGNADTSAVNCFFDNQTTGQNDYDLATGNDGNNTKDLMKEATFSNAGWDMTGTWWMENGRTRPFLRIQHSYTIHNGAQLQLIELDLLGNYKLARNVDLTEIKDPSYMWGTSKDAGKGFSQIGVLLGDAFKGSLDGRNYTISELYIYDTGEWGPALFSYMEEAVLQNIRFRDFNITGQSVVGGLFGWLSDDTVATIIENCHGENITIRSEYEVSIQDVGVMGAAISGGNIFNCSASHSSIHVNADQVTDVGGLVGRAGYFGWDYRAYIRNSSSDVDIYAPGSGGTGNVGGFIGGTSLPLTIENCSSAGSVIGGKNTGGFMGGFDDHTYINNSYSTCDVTGVENTGGFVGKINEHWETNSSISSCSASGLVRGETNTGGFAGLMYGYSAVYPVMIKNCSTTSPVSNSTRNTNTNTGGFIGRVTNDADLSLYGIFRSGHVISGTNSGTFIGDFNSGDITVSSSYYNNETCSLPSVVGTGSGIAIQGLSTTDMLTQASYPDWDFTETWGIVEGDSFPYLRSTFPEVPRQFNGYLLDRKDERFGPMEFLNVIVNGEHEGKIYTGDDGYYYDAYPNDIYNRGDIIVLYGSGNSGKLNNTVIKVKDEGVYRHDIKLEKGAVHVYDAAGTEGLSVSEIMTARDENETSAKIYEVLSSGIELDYDISFMSEGTTKIVLDENLTSKYGSEIEFRGVVDAAEDVMIEGMNTIFKNTVTGTGSLTVDGDCELHDDTSTPYQTYMGPVEIKDSVYMNGTSIVFEQYVEGNDQLSVYADLRAGSNITTGGWQTYGGRVSFTGSHTTLTATTVVFEGRVTNDYGPLTVNGGCEIHENIETLTNQIYNGDVVLRDNINMTTTGNGDIIFIGSLSNGGTPMDLNMNTGTGDIRFMGDSSLGELNIDSVGDINNGGDLSSETLTVSNCQGMIDMGTFVISGPAEIHAEELQGEIITESLALDVVMADITGEVNALSGEAGAEEIELLAPIIMNRVFFDGIDMYSFGPDDKTQAIQDEYYYNIYDAKYPADEVVTWSMDTNASSWISIDPCSGLLSGTPGNEDVGSYWIEVTVADDYGNQTSRNFTLTVMNVNDPLEIVTDDVEEAVEDANYSVKYEGDDIDVDSLTWSLNTNATWLSMTNNHLYGTPTNDDVGTYWVNVTVSDCNGGTDWSNFTLTVENVNDPPVITTADVTEAIEGVAYSVDYEASDVDANDVLTWGLDTKAAWLGIVSTSGVLSGTPEPGIFYANVSVDDGNGGTDWSNFTLKVYSDEDGDGTPDYIDPDFLTVVEYNNQTVYSNNTVYQNNTNNVTVGVSNEDTDGDGWSDAVEILAGTDPLDADDMPMDSNDNGVADFMDPDLEATTKVETEKVTPAWVWGALIAAVILGLIAIVLVLKKPPKRKEEEVSKSDVEEELSDEIENEESTQEV